MEKKQCYFCTNNIRVIDYKNAELMRMFVNPQARILPRKRTGVCSLCQRKLALAVKHARFMALISFVHH